MLERPTRPRSRVTSSSFFLLQLLFQFVDVVFQFFFVVVVPLVLVEQGVKVFHQFGIGRNNLFRAIVQHQYGDDEKQPQKPG